MDRTVSQRSGAPAPPTEGHHYRELFWHTLGRMILLYFMPLLLLAVFFHIQYRHILREGLRAHLGVMAEHQANTFDLFLRERLVNLANIIDDPLFPISEEVSEQDLRGFLTELQQTSDAFVDLGAVDAEGGLVAYVGPVDFPSSVTYRDEPWFQNLRAGDDPSIITEIYLGFRGMPHFTVAVKRTRGGTTQVLRSTLSPERLSDYLTGLEGASEVHAAIVNGSGILQVTTSRTGDPLQESRFVPPAEPERGYVIGGRGSVDLDYAYAWLSQTPWALVVTSTQATTGIGVIGLPGNVLLFTLGLFLLMGVVVFVRTRQRVGYQLETEQTQAELSGQLVQAAKLASVGELAAGIAHEINNPLAVIAEEVGMLRDTFDPELTDDEEPLDLEEHLGYIHEAVFRCRDITRKLLTFVRQTEVKLEMHHLHDILNEVLEGMLGNELAITQVESVRRYDDDIPEILTDRHQLIQVFLNLVKNAMDAMPRGGVLTVTTIHRGDKAIVSVTDTGIGMTQEQLERVFMPFFTTKEPGKGTGLGLSVSYSIIKNFGGRCFVDSEPGMGSTFTIELPYELR